MGRPKFRETWCKLLDATDAPCVLHHKHNEERCKPAMGPNERVARNNCAGPHEYEATLQRIVKGERLEDERAKAAPGVELGAKAKAGWADVAAASAKREAEEAKPRAAVPVQTSFLGAEPPPTEYQDIEVWVPVSGAEADMLDRDAAIALAKADERTADLARIAGPIKDDIKALRKEASDKAKQSKERKRLVKQRVKVVYHVNRATVEFLDPETGEEVQMSRAMTPKEVERFSAGGTPDDDAADPPEGDAVPVDAEPLEDDGPPSSGPETGLPGGEDSGS